MQAKYGVDGEQHAKAKPARAWAERRSYEVTVHENNGTW